MNQGQKTHKKRFVLTMRNEKGQVGIFVALIFQVVFVFFAMLVNVGLVVHHKINLQQSTDLAAYYGAMKQAEIMNVMAHVNFQIRQAWKLFTWRYRVLGTFGIEKNSSVPGSGIPVHIQFPVTWDNPQKKPLYNRQSYNFACPSMPKGVANGITITDVPFMCMGHNGFADWISGNNQLSETYCKINCNAIDDIDVSSFEITKIPSVNTACIDGNCIGASIDTAILQANNILETTCNKLGPITTQMLALYYGNYIKDTGNRKNFIWMLAKNLGLSEAEMLDIDGNKVITGVKNTLKNNLTEANLTSINSNDTIVALNGVKGGFAESMLREITFEQLAFFLIDCKYGPGSAVKIKSIYAPGTLDLETNIATNLQYIMNAAGVQGIKDLFALNSKQVNTVGYEKNPWINVYYGVKATSEPKIPFLPLVKIKLNAVSFAKPFGGTIGPWYYKTWDAGNPLNSGTGNDLTQRTDFNLPVKTIDSLPPNPTLKGVREFLPNYSTYVGDTFSNESLAPDPENKGGLANTKIVAFYHGLLANKYGFDDSPISSFNKTRETTKLGQFGVKPDNWPKYADWYHLNSDINVPNFDALAVDRAAGLNSPKNSYMRDIELSVIAPNQFDVTYYSIDPDFYFNYLQRMSNGGAVQKMATITGTATPPVFPLDYGNTGVLINGIPKAPSFGVRNQMQVTHDLFKKASSAITSFFGNGFSEILFALDVIATKQSSLLTGWTFLNLATDGYTSFPGPTVTGGKYSMLFGTCDPAMNPWTDDFTAPHITDSTLPPVPGNCVTGGRTGYSVKLISSDILRSGRTLKNLGGPSMDGQIKNPIPDDFLQF